MESKLIIPKIKKILIIKKKKETDSMMNNNIRRIFQTHMKNKVMEMAKENNNIRYRTIKSL